MAVQWGYRNVTTLLFIPLVYVALDAFCLLEIYDHLKTLAVVRPDCPLEPTLEYVKERLRREKQKRKLQQKTSSIISDNNKSIVTEI